MNPSNLKQMLKKVSDTLNSEEQFIIPTLAKKASEAAEQFPFDISIIIASQILGKMAENDKFFITRSELNSLYDKVYTNNTKLGEVFASELNRNDLLKSAKYYNRTGEDTAFNDYESVADPILSNALEAAFNGTGYKPYSKATAALAEKVCNASLLEIGLAPKKISTLTGHDSLLLCEATYETPRGQSNVIIPVELKDGRALLPTMFLGQASFVDLQKEALVHHLISTAGKSFKINTDNVLKVLSDIQGGTKKVASEVEMAVIRLRSSKQDTPINSVIGLMVEADAEDAIIKDASYEKTQEHFDFANRVTKQDGAAKFLFSDRVVEAGRDVVARKMASLGYSHAQVKVAGVRENEIQYVVSVGVNAAIMAPVKVSNNLVHEPVIAIASGTIKSFNKEGIDELMKNTRPDVRMLAVASTSAGLKPTELVQQVKDAINEGNLLKAEDAINVLGEIDKDAQKTAIAILMLGLNKSSKPNEELNKVASRKVNDIPLMNSYNIFFPTE